MVFPLNIWTLGGFVAVNLAEFSQNFPGNFGEHFFLLDINHKQVLKNNLCWNKKSFDDNTDGTNGLT